MNQQERDKLLLEMHKNYQIINDTQGNIIKEQQEICKNYEEMKNRQTSMEEELKRLENIVTRMEYDHGRKLDRILEVLTGHTDKLEEHEKRFEKDEKVIEMHGYQIYGIEQKLQA